MHRFEIFVFTKFYDLITRVRGHSRSLEMTPFDRLHTTRSIVTLALSCTVYDIALYSCNNIITPCGATFLYLPLAITTFRNETVCSSGLCRVGMAKADVSERQTDIIVQKSSLSVKRSSCSSMRLPPAIIRLLVPSRPWTAE